jgi:hypothetical protein
MRKPQGYHISEQTKILTDPGLITYFERSDSHRLKEFSNKTFHLNVRRNNVVYSNTITKGMDAMKIFFFMAK